MSSHYTISAMGGWPKNERGEFVNPEKDSDYLAWLADGHSPALEPEDVDLAMTPTEKLGNLGLSVEDLKAILELS